MAYITYNFVGNVFIDVYHTSGKGGGMRFIHRSNLVLNMLFVFLSLISTLTFGEDSLLTLKGTVIEQACTVDSADVNKTVDIGDWSTKDLQGKPGRKTPVVAFSINLKECTVDTVSVSFSGKNSQQSEGGLSLDEGSSATGVVVELTEKDGSSLPLDKSSLPVRVDTNGDAEFTFGVHYTSTSSTVTAGNADASVIFNIIYE